jgi:hypothetical protein
MATPIRTKDAIKTKKLTTKNMSEINYFDDKFKAQSAFIKWDVVGKSVAGTLVDKNQKPDAMKAGEMQWVYTIKQDDGSVILVGGKPAIDMQMSNNGVLKGQKIALKYMGDKASKRPGMNATKVIQLFTPKGADGKFLMDEEWLASAGSNGIAPVDQNLNFSNSSNQAVDDGEIKVEDIPFNSPGTTPTSSVPAGVPMSDDETNLAIIKQLAFQKLGANESNYQQLVMDNTGLAYIKINHEKIIEILGAK